MTESSGHQESATQIQDAVYQQGSLLGQHESEIQDLVRQLSLHSSIIDRLNQQVFELSKKVNNS